MLPKTRGSLGLKAHPALEEFETGEKVESGPQILRTPPLRRCCRLATIFGAIFDYSSRDL